MFEVKKFALIKDKIPTIGDIIKCVKKADEDNCVIELVWFISFNGWHSIIIYPGNNPQKIYDTLPKAYGV